MAGLFDNPDAVALIYLVGGVTFLLALFAGTVWTLARVLYYIVVGEPRPRLLTRDLIVYTGFSISFGLITLIRFLPLEERLALTVGNVLWALATTGPACVAVLTYLWYEVFVVKLGTRSAAEPEIP
jgi:hypothetical protein